MCGSRVAALYGFAVTLLVGIPSRPGAADADRTHDLGMSACARLYCVASDAFVLMGIASRGVSAIDPPVEGPAATSVAASGSRPATYSPNMILCIASHAATHILGRTDQASMTEQCKDRGHVEEVTDPSWHTSICVLACVRRPPGQHARQMCPEGVQAF